MGASELRSRFGVLRPGATARPFNSQPSQQISPTLVEDPPTLSISRSGPDVVLFWPSAATNYSLQQNPDLNPTKWTGYDASVIDDGTTKTVTVTNLSSSLFFRLLTTPP